MYADVKSSFQYRDLSFFKTAHIFDGSWIAENKENNSREWAIAEGGSISHHSNRNTTSAEWEVAPRFGCGKPCSSACQGGQKFHMILEFSLLSSLSIHEQIILTRLLMFAFTSLFSTWPRMFWIWKIQIYLKNLCTSRAFLVQLFIYLYFNNYVLSSPLSPPPATQT